MRKNERKSVLVESANYFPWIPVEDQSKDWGLSKVAVRFIARRVKRNIKERKKKVFFFGTTKKIATNFNYMLFKGSSK